MRKTAQQLTQQLTAPPLTRWIGEIIGVNVPARQVQVSIKGISGPKWIRAIDSIDFGVAQLPKVVVGNRAIIDLIDDQFFFTGQITIPGATTSQITPFVPNVPAPTSFTVTQQGNVLVCSWDPIQSAGLVSYYEIFQNLSATPSGAVITNNGAARTSGTSYTFTIVPAALPTIEHLSDGGFENGNLATAWTVTTSNGSASAVTTYNGTLPYTGSYLCNILTAFTSHPQSALVTLTSALTSATPGYVYSYSGQWGKTKEMASIISTISALINFYDTNQNLIVSTQVDSNTANTTWWPTSGNATAPSGTSYVALKISVSSSTTLNWVLGDSLAWGLDALSLQGVVGNQSALYYAVRAVGQYGQASPFSNWIQPTIVTSALGNTFSPHILFDYANARAQSNQFQSQQIGSHLGTDGIDGNIIPPGDKLAKYFFLR